MYKPGNVKLHPELLGKHQAYVKQQTGKEEDKPVFLVFHGGSGSSKQEYIDAIGHGVVKVNLDTDLQYAYLTGIRDYVLNKKDYIMKQVGNPDGEDKPNKVSLTSYLDTLMLIPRAPLEVFRSEGLGERGRENHGQACRGGSPGLQYREPIVGLHRRIIKVSSWVL